MLKNSLVREKPTRLFYRIASILIRKIVAAKSSLHQKQGQELITGCPQGVMQMMCVRMASLYGKFLERGNGKANNWRFKAC